MERDKMYFLYKNILSQYGAIPRSEKEYEKLMDALLTIYELKEYKDEFLC